MHVEEIRESIQDMRRYEGVPITALTDMRLVFRNSWVLTKDDKLKNYQKERKLKGINESIIRAKASITNIYDGLDSLEKFIDSDPPKFYNEKPVEEWQRHRKNSALSILFSAATFGAGYLVEKYTGANIVDELLYTLTGLSSAFGLYSMIREQKVKNDPVVRIYRSDIRRYNDLETEVSVGIDRLRVNFNDYFSSMDHLVRVFYEGKNPVLTSSNDENITLYNERMKLFYLSLPKIIKTLEDAKLGKRKYHEFLDLNLLAKKLYHPQIYSNYVEKEKINWNNAKSA